VGCDIPVHRPGLRRPGLVDNAEILDPRAPVCVMVLSIFGEGENPMQDAARQARMTACMRSVCIVVCFPLVLDASVNQNQNCRV
jgi:hypothetical protein